MKFYTSVVLAFASLLRLGLADLPVHCLRHQVQGDWEFTLGPLGPKRSSCGHRKPDIPTMQPHMKFLEQQGQLTTRKFSLQDPNTVETEDGSSGTWTMIYDEGFEVAVGDLVYFAFSKFSLDPSAPDGQNNVSHCGETQIGWYHDTGRSQWGCYVGKKANPSADDTVGPTQPPAPKASDSSPALALEAFGSDLDVATAVDDDDKPKQVSLSAVSSDSSTAQSTGNDESEAASTKQDDSVAQTQESLEDLYKEPADYKPWVPSSAGFDQPMQGNWQQSVADALNFLQLGWTASAYDQFQGKTPRELNRFAGVKRHRIHGQAKAQSVIAADDVIATSFLGLSSKHRHKKIHRSKAKAKDEETFDWRNKDGTNYLEPIVTQGDCGSCYTISTVHMLTARNKIRAGSASEPSFSVSFPLYCSEYNQGCDGGYGFLQSKWNEDVGLVPEKCLPFSQGGGSCAIASNCDLGSKRYRAHNHHYVGGYYGASDADAIRQELLEKGPLVMSFEPKEDFMYYKQGVYKSGPNKIHQEWEQVDHAVLLAGYGMDSNQPYWTLQNSWGTDWGEDGYFRMARGVDESGVESIAVAADVVEEDANTVLDQFIAEL